MALWEIEEFAVKTLSAPEALPVGTIWIPLRLPEGVVAAVAADVPDNEGGGSAVIKTLP